MTEITLLELPKKDFALPAKPVVNGKPTSILEDAERKAFFADFQANWNRANSKPPSIDSFASGAEYAKEMAARQNNPLNDEVGGIRATYTAIIAGSKNAVEGNRKAQEFFEQESEKLANGYMNAVDIGAKNAQVEAGQKSAMGQLFQFPPNFVGAAQTFIMSMPAVSAWIESMMSNFMGEKMSYEDVLKRDRTNLAANGLAVSGFISAENAAAYGKQIFAKPSAAPAAAVAPANSGLTLEAAAEQANIPLDDTFDPAAFAAIPDLEKKANELIGKGTIKKADNGTYYATTEAVNDLNSVVLPPGQTPPSEPTAGFKRDKSWAQGQ